MQPGPARWLIAAFVLSSLAAAGAARQSDPAFGGGAFRTVWDGVYTEAQAERGRAAYAQYCAGCHRPDLAGEGIARALKGDDFMERWREYDLGFLFALIRDQMPPPPEPPGTERVIVPPEASLAILTHLLRGNGFPAGAGELTFDALSSVRIERRDGPEPVPNFSLVRVAGCLLLVDGVQWVLADASPPRREQAPDGATPQELAESAAAPAGPYWFRLVNYEYIAPDFTPAPFLERKVQVKGFLVRQPGAERINVTSLAPVAESCTP